MIKRIREKHEFFIRSILFSDIIFIILRYNIRYDMN